MLNIASHYPPSIMPYNSNFQLFSFNSILKAGLIASLFNTVNAQILPSLNTSHCNLYEYSIENLLHENQIKFSQDKNFETLPIETLSADFPGVELGDFVFFSHVNNLRQLAISTFQKSNLTHVGIVTGINAKKISVAEIPGYGKSTTISTYDLDNLKNDEELIFTSPSASKITKESLATFSNNFLSLTEIPENYNQYDFQSLFSIPLQSKNLDEKAKKNLIDSFIEYSIFGREPHSSQNQIIGPKKYFCSSFVTELYQLSQMAMKIPTNLMQGLNHLKNASLDNPVVKSELVNNIYSKWNEIKFWDYFQEDPIFQLSSKASTPENLYELTKEISGKSIVVRNPNAIKRFDSENLSDDQALDFLEYQITKLVDRINKQETIELDDPQVQDILVLLEKTFDYSKESLNCFLKDCIKNEDPSFCVESCLEKTLTLKEKLHIFLISRQINRVFHRFLHEPKFLKFIHEPKIEQINTLKNLKVEELLQNRWDIAFPTNTFDLDSAENVLAKKILQKLDRKTLVKYIPLAIAYSPPKEVLKNFITEENISLIELSKMALLTKQLGQGRRGTEQLSQILQLTDRLGFSKYSKEIIKPSLKITAQQTGYSIETLDCISNDLLNGEIDAARGKECIETTLTLKEKLWVYLSSQSISHAVDNIIENKEFLHFIKNGKTPKNLKVMTDIKSKELLLDILFPQTNENFSDAVMSMIGRKMLSMSIDSGMIQFLMKDVFLGLNYNPQTKKLSEFLKNENLNLYTLLLKIEEFSRQL